MNDESLQKVYQQVAEIAKKNHVKKIVLFGSRARKTNLPKSDIDLAVYGCKDFLALSEQLNEELWTLLELDIIDMNASHLSEEFVEEINRDGVVIYEEI